MKKSLLSPMSKVPFSLESPSRPRNPFRTPEGYMASLPERIMQHIRRHAEADRMQRLSTATYNARSPWFIRYMPYIGVACVMVLAVIFSGLNHSMKLQTGSLTEQTTSWTLNQQSQKATYSSEADQAYDYLMLADAEYYYTSN